MPVRFRGPLPRDHPIFHGGVSFAFRHDLPEEREPEQDESGHNAVVEDDDPGKQ